MLDLSFALNVPLHDLRRMSERDLRLYHRYTQRHGFPGRRLELLLAQVSMVLAQVNGNKVQLSDFLMDPPPEPAPGDPQADPDAIANYVGFSPRNRKP